MSRQSGTHHPRKIWIDVDNSPHVPFFVPIIEELERRGYVILLTSRDCAQVCDLVNLYKLACKRVGRHYGKTTIVKLVGLLVRALQLIPTIGRAKPDLALSHGSRAQLVVSTALGIPSLSIDDYEFSKGFAFIRPTWLMFPEIVPESAVPYDPNRILKYPGIKEDVYVSRFKPDTTIRAQLGFEQDVVVVTVRPPADDAHYHNRESDKLFHAAVDFVTSKPNTRIVLLPRRGEQAVFARRKWPDYFATGKMMIPADVVDGLNLIWHSDLVISGGGTMNREAAALGVPVYSIFRGKIGAVDRYLAEQGRLTLIENIEDMHKRIVLTSRDRRTTPESSRPYALHTIVNHVVAILESKVSPSPSFAQ